MKDSARKAMWAKKQLREKFLKSVKVGDTVTVYVSPDEPRRRIKVTEIHERYKDKGDTGGITGVTPDGARAWARASQIFKINPTLKYHSGSKQSEYNNWKP